MLALTSRAGRWPLALAVATLAACADDSSTTAPPSQPKPTLAVGDVITVTTTSGGTDTGSLRWAAAQAAGGEIIRFDPSLAGATIVLDTTLVMLKSVTIEGPKDKGITISAGGRGRVIHVEDHATLRNLSVTGGKLPDGIGAGILAWNVVLEHSTVWGNEARYSGAIHAMDLDLINSTVSGNVSTNVNPSEAHPVISIGNSAYVINSTIAHNPSGGVGGSTFWLRNSIIAKNGSSNCWRASAMVWEGRNLSDNASCGDATRMLIGDPVLDDLRANGGPSMTHALLPTSPALDAGTACTVAVDQRYVARDAQCDIGAFEDAVPTTVAITIDPSASVDLSRGTARVTGTVTCSRAGDQFSVRARLKQQKTDNAQTVVQGSGDVGVTCSTTAQRWSALVVPSAGAFKLGAAAATATTHEAPRRVTPSTTSKSITLLRPRS